MDVLLRTLFSYPVLIYSVLFIVVVIYWLICAMGLVDFDSGGGEVDLDLDLDVDADVDLDLDGDADVDAGSGEGGSMGMLSGLLFKFGLYGIPVTITISLLIVFAWFFAAVTMRLLPGWTYAGFLRYLVGSGVLVGSLVVSAWLTGRLISPIRNFLDRRKEDVSPRSLCGREGIVRSGKISENGGQVQLVKDGSTYIVNAQALPDDKELCRDDVVYLIEYLAATNTYTVVSEEKFKGK